MKTWWSKMQKIIVFAVALLIVFVCFNESYARRGKNFYETYDIIEINKDGIVIQDFEGARSQINKDSEGYQVGDRVRYDNTRDRLKKAAWQPAKVISITDRIITLQLSNNEIKEVNMRSGYRNKFQKGDSVKYKDSTGQIMEDNLQTPEEEQ
jgi:hypothetical protein